MDQETPRFHHTTRNKFRKAAPNFAQNTPEYSSASWIDLVGKGIKLDSTRIKIAATWIKLDGAWIKLPSAWIKMYGDWIKLIGKPVESAA